MILWNNDIEKQFFTEALKNFASPEQLFYNLKSGYFAYVPKGADAEGQTLQSRNFGRFIIGNIFITCSQFAVNFSLLSLKQ